ncbi:hypothetical protein LLE49_04870 [Alicyclobacillus tolerans]|nr:hypothetical protein [Alicyclobacillus tolerans]MCF8564070.1 hypothetical protein [Alicyclobacillus tolerans]
MKKLLITGITIASLLGLSAAPVFAATSHTTTSSTTTTSVSPDGMVLIW